MLHHCAALHGASLGRGERSGWLSGFYPVSGSSSHGARRIFLLAAFTFRDFLAIHTYIAGCFDAYAHLRAVHRHYRDFHVVSDAESLTGSSS